MATTEFSQEQCRLVMKSWEAVASNLPQNGVDIFMAFFQQHPTYKNFFRHLRDESLSELRTSPKLKGHGSRVMYTFASLVANLEDTEVLEEMVIKIALDHIPRGIKVNHYQELFETIIGVLKQKLGAKFDASSEEAWKSLSIYLVSLIQRTLDQRK